ncbi:MAG: tetratricopeptide repeat protein [Chitinophagaceae bacterium]|nr:tetratricopeptide repeat protein [Chitinophagaceae bacterium]
MNDVAEIEKYLAGELNSEALQAFEQRLQTDSAFAEVFSLYKSVETEMTETEDERAFREKLSGITQKHFTTGTEAKIIPLGSKIKKWWLYAAAAAAIITLFIFKPWSDKPLTNEQLYAQYAVPDELPAVVRGANEDSLLIKTTGLFNRRNFAAALPLLDSLVKLRPEEAQLLLSFGICQLETGHYNDAVNTFDRLANTESSFKYKAMAWKAYTYLKQNKTEPCIAALQQIPANAAEYEKAKAVIKKLLK